MSGKFKHLLVGSLHAMEGTIGGTRGDAHKTARSRGPVSFIGALRYPDWGCRNGPYRMCRHSESAAAGPDRPSAKTQHLASDVIGRWGLGAYHRAEDRARTESITKGQCNMPYVIGAGNEGTVTMLTHDSPTFVEVQIKANQEGRTFIGPGQELGGPDDREVMSYNGRVLILRWTDPEVAGRYGTQVLVRCAPKA
jgi:hypothetical protein